MIRTTVFLLCFRSPVLTCPASALLLLLSLSYSLSSPLLASLICHFMISLSVNKICSEAGCFHYSARKCHSHDILLFVGMRKFTYETMLTGVKIGCQM